MGLENDNPTGNYQEIDADQLLSDIEQGTAAPSAPTEGQTQETPTAQTQAPQTPAEYEFEAAGNKIKISPEDPRFKQWLGQGYMSAQDRAQFNLERQNFEKLKGDYEKTYTPYREIDEYAKQNPEWWKQVEEAYKNRSQQVGQQQAHSELPQWAKEKLDKADQFISKFEAKEAAEIRAKEDTQLAEEIQSIQKQYEYLDWKTPNDKGLSLEQRVLDHAVKNGIQSFKTAFIDLNHEDLLKRAEERGKENINKDIQRRNKLGILGTSQKPTKGVAPAENVKTKSWGDLEREAKEELGIA